MSNNHITDAEELAVNKRAALAGQWRTPPVPVYPSGYRGPESVPSAPPPQPPSGRVHDTELPNPSSIPANSDEYAKALQEAYRKGAEAAARMAHQRMDPHMPTAASCPDFSIPDERTSPYPVHPTPTLTPDALGTSSMPPPPPQHPHHHPYSTVGQQQPHTLSIAMNPPSHYSAPQPPPPPPTSHHTPPPPPHYTTIAAPAPTGSLGSSVPTNPPPQGRSISMPDMASYAVQAEEEKRQKRLARNRQSARLRRQRKKNLVRNEHLGMLNEHHQDPSGEVHSLVQLTKMIICRCFLFHRWKLMKPKWVFWRRL